MGNLRGRGNACGKAGRVLKVCTSVVSQFTFFGLGKRKKASKLKVKQSASFFLKSTAF